MVPVAWRMIWKEKARFLITVVGIGFTLLLILFLLGIHEGAKNGATAYILNSPADIWICQNNSNNLLRSSSFLHSSLEREVQQVHGVHSVSGILRLITIAKVKSRSVTIFLIGFDPGSNLGAPSSLVQGTAAIGSGEIILDKALASKHMLSVGDSLQIQGRNFRLSGISEGTNAILAQFAFITLEDAQRLLRLPSLISFCLLTTTSNQDHRGLVESLKRRFPSLAIFSKKVFVENQLEEMEAGVLPVLWTIALFGISSGATVMTLMLYGSVLEKREDYALLKAVGASQNFVVALVLKQSLLGATTGYAFGLMLNFICAPLLTRLVPEVTLLFTWRAAAIVLAASLLIGAIASWAPIHKLARIYPAEVFRA